MRHAIYHAGSMEQWAAYFAYDRERYITRAIFPFKTRDGLSAFAVNWRVHPRYPIDWQVVILAKPSEGIPVTESSSHVEVMAHAASI